MTNARIADIFDEMADLFEFQAANPFRVRAYRNSARTIRNHPESLANILHDPDRKLTDLEGIGKDRVSQTALGPVTRLTTHDSLLTIHASILWPASLMALKCSKLSAHAEAQARAQVAGTFSPTRSPTPR